MGETSTRATNCCIKQVGRVQLLVKVETLILQEVDEKIKALGINEEIGGDLNNYIYLLESDKYTTWMCGILSKCSYFIVPWCYTQHRTDSCSANIGSGWGGSVMLISSWWITRTGRSYRGSQCKSNTTKATWATIMTRAGQSSPFSLPHIGQSEDAALEIWNALNKMKWTNMTAKNVNKWQSRGKWKSGRREGRHRALRITNWSDSK